MIPLQYKLIGSALLIVALMASYGLWKRSIYKDGYNTCQAEVTKAVEDGKEKYAKTAKEIRRLPDDTLRKRYCLWMRDDPKACMSGPSPFID